MAGRQTFNLVCGNTSAGSIPVRCTIFLMNYYLYRCSLIGVERRTFNPVDAGSSPVSDAKLLYPYSSIGRAPLCEGEGWRFESS